MNNYEHQEKGGTPFTPAIQTLYALEEALKELAEERVTGRIARYSRAAHLLRKGFHGLGLSLPVAPSLRSNTITTINLPNGLTYPVLHDKLRKKGFVIYAGQGKLSEQAFRVANMGALTEDDFESFLAVLGEVL